MASLALNMIVKNEEENLVKNNFRAIFSFFDEVVVVDTGSTDNTIFLCKGWGAKVVESNWIDDFSYSRNIAKQNTTADYIFWLDGDDEIEEKTVIAIRKIIENAPNSIFLIRLVNINNKTDELIYQKRVFPNRKDIEFNGVVHEHLTYNIKNYTSYKTDEATVFHKGYSSVEITKKKIERNTKVLLKAIESGSKNSLYYYYLSSTFLYEKEDVEKADLFVQEILNYQESNTSGGNIYPYAIYVKSDIERCRGNILNAIEYMQKAISLVPEEVNFHHALGFLYFLKGDYSRACEIFDTVLLFQDFSPKGYLPVAVEKIRSEALYYKTLCSFYLNDFSRAIEIGEKFLTTYLAEKDFMVPLFLAKSWFVKKNYVKAKHYYRLSEKNLGKYPDWQLFFENYDSSGFDKFQVIKKRLSKDRLDFFALYYMGVLFEEKNDPQAKDFYLKSFEINPVYENARRAILRLEKNYTQHIHDVMKLLALN